MRSVYPVQRRTDSKIVYDSQWYSSTNVHTCIAARTCKLQCSASQLADRCPQRRALPGGARTSRLVAMAAVEVLGVGVLAKEADC
jgi:hypothetical protein